MLVFLFPIISFATALFLGKPIIQALIALKSQQSFRELGPQSHIQEKAGTPTMGAWIFLVPIFLLGIILHFWHPDQRILLSLLALFAGTLIGGIDDVLKITQSSYKGLNSKQKLLVQIIISSAIAFFSERYLFSNLSELLAIDLPEWLIMFCEFIWATLVITGSSNAINLTDGLDGLSAGICALSFSALAWIFFQIGEVDLLSFCLIIVFALIAFIIFNFKPAQVFMGDTGSLALGMAMGALAYLNNLEWYLIIFALVPVLETLSVILQVSCAKLSRKFLKQDIRPFKMAPLHHHFELCGIPEVFVVLSFWLFQAICIITFFSFKTDFIPVTFM